MSEQSIFCPVCEREWQARIILEPSLNTGKRVLVEDYEQMCTFSSETVVGYLHGEKEEMYE